MVEAVRKLQQNPKLSAFRIHVALEGLGIHLSTRTCGRILARNRQLSGLRRPDAKPRNEPKAMPFPSPTARSFGLVDSPLFERQDHRFQLGVCAEVLYG